MMEGDPNMGEIFLSPDATREFDNIKYDNIFRRMDQNDFEVIFAHYRKITSLRLVIQKSAQIGIRNIYSLEILEADLASCSRALKVLEKNLPKH